MSERNEWYTPLHIIEAVKQIAVDIDLDPFSCAKANEVVQAESYYTKKEPKGRCGLSLPWHGCVWINPPYERGFPAKVAQKLRQDLGNIDMAFVLTNNCTDTAWWHELAKMADLTCFLRGRLKFWGPNDASSGAAQGQTLMLVMGSGHETPFKTTAHFEQVFGKLGRVL